MSTILAILICKLTLNTFAFEQDQNMLEMKEEQELSIAIERPEVLEGDHYKEVDSDEIFDAPLEEVEKKYIKTPEPQEQLDVIPYGEEFHDPYEREDAMERDSKTYEYDKVKEDSQKLQSDSSVVMSVHRAKAVEHIEKKKEQLTKDVNRSQEAKEIDLNLISKEPDPIINLDPKI